MCGIFGILSKQNFKFKDCVKALKKLEYRGYDSAGVAYMMNSNIEYLKKKGKINNLENTSDGRCLIEISGLSRFKIVKEIKNDKLYRECEVNFDDFSDDVNFNKEKLKFSDLELIFKDLKSLFEKKGYLINWKSLEKQDLNETINALAMASPFSLEEKQVLLESKSLEIRKNKISEILSTYNYDNFENTTIQ